jgi:hypothetical protein
MREVKTLKEAVGIYDKIEAKEYKLDIQCREGEGDNQEWINAVYRTMGFPSYDENWEEITMRDELLKEWNNKKLYMQESRAQYKAEISDKVDVRKVRFKP